MKRKAIDQPKEQRRKKPKDMPRRPLSAYNLFFRAEREKIMDNYERGKKDDDFVVPAAPNGNDPKEIKSHNAAVFQAVARTIADRWRNMEKSKKAKYEEQAAVEMKKYRARMEEYEQHMIRNSNITKRNEERLQQGVRSLSEPIPPPTVGTIAPQLGSEVATSEAESLSLPPVPLQAYGAGNRAGRLDHGQALIRSAYPGQVGSQPLDSSSGGHSDFHSQNLPRFPLQMQYIPDQINLQDINVALLGPQGTSMSPFNPSNAGTARASAVQHIPQPFDSVPQYQYARLQQQLQLEQELQQLVNLHVQQNELQYNSIGPLTLAGFAPGPGPLGVSQQTQNRHGSHNPNFSAITQNSVLPLAVEELRIQALAQQRHEIQQRNRAMEQLLLGTNSQGGNSQVDRGYTFGDSFPQNQDHRRSP